MSGRTRTGNARPWVAFGAWGCRVASQAPYPVKALSCDSTCRLRDLSPCSRSDWGLFMIPLLNSAQPHLAQPGLEFTWKDTEDSHSGAEAQPLSQFSQVALATTQYSWLWMVSIGAGSLYWQHNMAFDGGGLPLPFTIMGHVSTVYVRLLLMRLLGSW